MDINRVTLLGYIVHAPRSRKLPSGDTVARFAVATNFRFREGGPNAGERRTEFHQVVVWGALATVAIDQARRGRRVLVDGRLCTRKYVGKSGTAAAVTEIIASQILIGGSLPAEGRTGRTALDEVAT